MTEFDPITGCRLASYTYSGIASSEDAMNNLSELVISLCDDLLSQSDLSVEQRLGVQRTKSWTPEIFKSYIFWMREKHWSEDSTQNALFLLVTLADNMLSLGSLAMRDPASAAIVESIISGGQKGGQAGGATRRGKAAGDAALIASKAAQIRADHPEWSQDDVATEIAALWTGTGKVPGHTKIKGVLSGLERSGKLPRRRTDKSKSVNEGGSTS